MAYEECRNFKLGVQNSHYFVAADVTFYEVDYNSRQGNRNSQPEINYENKNDICLIRYVVFTENTISC